MWSSTDKIYAFNKNDARLLWDEVGKRWCCKESSKLERKIRASEQVWNEIIMHYQMI